MTPLDFVHFDGDSSPNEPIYLMYEAMDKNIRVHGPDGDYEILSYYLSDGHFHLDVQRKKVSKRK